MRAIRWLNQGANLASFQRTVRPKRSGFWAQFSEVSSSLRAADILVWTLIIFLGISQFFFCSRESDFRGDDVFWVDSGRSLVDRGFYGINGYSETNMPPGLPAFLGVMGDIWGYSPVIFLHAMTVFGTLTFLASYELIRHQAPRIVAAAICLLLMTSVTHFKLVTQEVWPCYPYAFTTLSALLVAIRFERATALTSRIILGTLLAVLVIASLLLASAAIALLGAIVVSILVIFLRNRDLALNRLKIYFPILLLAIAVQGLWMHRERVAASAGISAGEWPLPGFPQSYLSQLKVKNGNDPELGLVTTRDAASRVLENARSESDMLSRALVRRLPSIKSAPGTDVKAPRVQLGWSSIFVAVSLLLVTLGWCNSVRRGESSLQAWYFAGYEFIYLLWPWDWETRFFLPIAPLVCFYLWRGAETLALLAKNIPRVIAIVWLPLATILTIGAALSIHGPPTGSQSPYLELQDELSFVVWLLSAILAAWMIWANTAWWKPFSTVLVFWRRSIGRIPLGPRRLFGGLSMAFMICLVLIGLTMQFTVGQTNLDPNSITNHSADAEAGIWIAFHTPSSAVVMARQVPTVYHYSKRKVIWFPPSSNPHLLMDGIKEHNINVVIVAHRESSYYLPPEDICFGVLLATYPGSFHLLYQASEFKIFEVATNGVSRSQHILRSPR